VTPHARLVAALVSLGVALLLIVTVAILIGSADLSPGAVLRVLAGRAEPGSLERVVTLDLRLPRIAAAVLAGGGLALAGVAFQALTRNPLAEPSVLGVSSGAAFGAVVGQILGFGLSVLEAAAVTALAFAGAMISAGIVYAVAWRRTGLALPSLLLAGVIVGIFFSAAITVVISVVDANRLAGVVHWLLGNVAPIPAASLALFGALVGVGLLVVVRHARELNLLALGEESAFQLGVDTERLKRRIFVAAALLTGAVVAFTGPIGFVGLIVPHLLRGVVGPDNRLLAPTAMVGGGLFLLVADTLARSIVAPAELPVGIVTALCGAPFFVYLLRTRYEAAL
jgi:iron complex transport system permease protein